MLQLFVPKEAADHHPEIQPGSVIIGSPKGAGSLIVTISSPRKPTIAFDERVAVAHRIFMRDGLGARRMVPAAHFIAVAEIDDRGRLLVSGKKERKALENWTGTKKKTPKKKAEAKV